MREETIGGYLEALAARIPAPGGGAAAALHAAQAASLLGMVARYSTGEKYATHAEVIGGVIEAADRLREESLRLAEADAAAFGAVAEAYQLPKDTPAAQAARSAAIGRALQDAAVPPGSVIEVATELLRQAQALLPVGNRGLITDVAAAASAVSWTRLPRIARFTA